MAPNYVVVFNRPKIALVLGVVATTAILLLSHGSVIAFVKRRVRARKGYEPLKELYEDPDGRTTEEFQTRYRKTVRYPTTIAFAASVLGLGVAITATVFQARYGTSILIADACLRLGSWLFLCLQAVHSTMERRPLVLFRTGFLAMVSAVIILFELAVVCFLCVHWQAPTNTAAKLLVALPACQAGLAVIAIVCFMLIPRRPVVFTKDGKSVDAEFTISILSRLLFAWAVPLLAYVRKNKGLTLEEVPILADYIRAETLQRTFDAEKKEGRRLWLQILVYLRGAFTKQMILIGLVSITQFFPQLAMYNLLNLLEKRSMGDTVDAEAWFWVVALFLTMVVSSWIEAFLFWIVMSQIAVPCRNLLSSLVFVKSTRRKDVKGAGGAKEGASKPADENVIKSAANGNGHVKTDATAKTDQKSSEDDDEERMKKSRQNTVNLVGVDTQRVANFCSYVWVFPGSVIKLTISVVFLWKLVGGFPLLAGIIAFSLSQPLNVLFARKYTGLQGILMKLRDFKLAVVTEALQGIRQIKFSALEDQWQEHITDKRNKELSTLWTARLWDCGLLAIWVFGPVMLAAALLVTYALIHGSLSPSIAFTAVAILSAIEMTLAIIPELTTDALDAWVSLKRIEDYLNAPEKVDCLTASDSIALRSASVAWPADSEEADPDRFVLRDVDIEFPRGELSVITGKTGSGKSLLLAALLGEVDKLAGSIEMPKCSPLEERFDVKATKDNWILDSAVAFVAQTPWIENATIKENITWGLPLDNQRYANVLQVCALEKDLDMFEDGDMTDIGANGINLSGGQRWRVSFARALYSRAGILVLDDIFSAVDAHVGKQLFEEALTGDLGHGRTRILVTHHIRLCISKTKYSVKIENGQIEYAGYMEDLERSGHIEEILKDDAVVKAEEEALEEVEEANNDETLDGEALRLVLSRRRSSVANRIDDSAGAPTKTKAPKLFNETEKRELGRVKTHVYMDYIRLTGGAKMWVPLMIIFLLNMGLPILRSYTITLWTRSYETESSNAHHAIISNVASDVYYPWQSSTHNENSTHQAHATRGPNQDLWFYLAIYLMLSLLSITISTLRFLVTFLASIRASRRMFEQMLFAVLRAPIRWLDTVPVGRVLNRFSTDMNQVDSSIAYQLCGTISTILNVIGVTITAVFVSPLMLPVALVLLCVVFMIAQYYLSGAREIKRIESVAKSPIFEQFGSVLAGIGTIRAFDKTLEYKTRMYVKIDGFARAHWHTWVFNRWMGLQLNFVGAVFALIVATVVVSANIDAALAGFALSFALQYTQTIISLMRNYAQLEMIMNAVERIIEYIRLPTEDLGGDKPPAAWPTKGRIEVSNLVAGYAPDLPPVLKGLSFTVEPHQRIGVVGRTGAGKSTLSLALWRFIHVREGSVHVDGINTASMTLHDLRSRLAIIPQDPVLFSGTVRSNMDPFNDHSDDELHDALQRVHLISDTSPPSRDEGAGSSEAASAADTNTNIFKSLSSPISEGGLSLSQGQRQLLCLARTIVRKPRIMLLDEATSAVDMATDVLIQRSIREEFRDSTLLVIAHRLSTIVDFDRILVMSDGKAVEYDTPRALWESKGLFYDMCCSSGEKDLLEKIINADLD